MPWSRKYFRPISKSGKHNWYRFNFLACLFTFISILWLNLELTSLKEELINFDSTLSSQSWLYSLLLFVSMNYQLFVLSDSLSESSLQKDCCRWLTFRLLSGSHFHSGRWCLCLWSWFGLVSLPLVLVWIGQFCQSSVKRQSPTKIFLKTTLTRTIAQHKQLILLGSNHLPESTNALFTRDSFTWGKCHFTIAKCNAVQ